MGRTASGVRGIRLRAEDHVVGSAAIDADTDMMLTITDAGYGKRTEVSNFKRQGRGGQGIRAHRLSAARGRLLTGFLVDTDDDVLLITDGGVVMRTSVADISTQGRDATGVRVMAPGDGNKVAAVARVLPGEDEAEDGAETVDEPMDSDGDGAGDDGEV